MKKISLTAFVSFLAIATQAQDHENFEPFKDRDFLFDILHIGTMLIAIYLIASFILQIFKAGMTARIKNRMLDKNTEENIVKELLQPDKKENKNYILQWFFIMIAIGIAFLATHAHQSLRTSFAGDHCILYCGRVWSVLLFYQAG